MSLFLLKSAIFKLVIMESRRTKARNIFSIFNSIPLYLLINSCGLVFSVDLSRSTPPSSESTYTSKGEEEEEERRERLNGKHNVGANILG